MLATDPLRWGMRRVSLRRRIEGVVVCVGVDLPIPVVLGWELPCVNGALLLVLTRAINGMKGAVEEEEFLRHIGDASDIGTGS